MSAISLLVYYIFSKLIHDDSDNNNNNTILSCGPKMTEALAISPLIIHRFVAFKMIFIDLPVP